MDDSQNHRTIHPILRRIIIGLFRGLPLISFLKISRSHKPAIHFSSSQVKRDSKALIPLIHGAQKLCRTLQLMASPWSPPAWMKVSKAWQMAVVEV